MMLSISVRQFSFLLVALFTMTVLSYSPHVFAANTPIGQMIWVKGAIKAAQPGSAPRDLQRRSAIFEHDIIETGSGSTGEMAFTDTSVVTLREGTEFKIDQYHYQPGGGSSDKSVMSVIKGGLRTITGVIPKENPDSYQLKTPVATIGVRGTQYSAYVSQRGLALKIDRGAILATNGAGQIELTKCNDPKKCKLYGVVSSYDSAPQTVDKMPIEFENEPPISDAPAGLGSPMMGPGGSGPSKTVSSFCVGLLKDLYSRMFG
ncbi:MAG: FecR family protein [Gammaproteobacteria bacterium]|nr:FecR family protein [Gammaproteobacteria bacterium]